MTDAQTHRRSDAQPSGRRFVRASVRLCLCASVLAACRSQDTPDAAAALENDVPVAINSESPFQYPPQAYDKGVEGEVRLRLYVDSAGVVHPDSTRVAASSGAAELDSAAVKGAALLRFAPAHRGGKPIGMAFYQPVIFRRPPRAGEPAP